MTLHTSPSTTEGKFTLVCCYNHGLDFWMPVDGEKADDQSRSDAVDSSQSTALTGTTLRVYRYLYREARPLNIHDIQRGLRLSSASVSQYHLRKLLQAGLIKEQEKGYVVDRVVFENMIRIRRSVIPFQVAYAVFFATLLSVLLVFLRPPNLLSPLFLFALAAIVSALVLFAYEAMMSLKRL